MRLRHRNPLATSAPPTDHEEQIMPKFRTFAMLLLLAAGTAGAQQTPHSTD